MPAGFPLFRPSNIPSGLQGYWKLDEASGSRADSSGNGYTLTDNNTVTANAFDYWKTGENSALFNSANAEYLSRTDTNALDFAGTSFTLVCWMRRGTDSGTAAFFSKNAASSDGYLFYPAAGDTRLNLYLNATLYTTGTGVVGASGSRKWQHVACVRDVSAGTVMFYVDGNLVYTVASAVTLAGNAIDFQIGKYGNSAAYFGGDMKDAACWNVALTPIQIKSLALGVDLSLYTYRPNNVSTQPTHWWKLNELSGSRADSATSNPLSLSVSNQVKTLGGYVEGAGAWCDKVSNSASGLTSSDSADWDVGTGDFSFAFWIKPRIALSGTSRIFSIGAYTANGVSCYHDGTSLQTYVDGSLYTEAWASKADTWTHMVFRRTSGTVSWVIDGVPYGTPTSKTGDITGSTYGLHISLWGDALSDCSDATFSDFAFWKTYSLSNAECASLACGIPLQQTGLVSYWKLDETSGNRVDSIGSNTLTDNNTVLSGTGKVGNAADFELSNSEYLSITDGAQSGLDVTTDGAIGAWINAESSAASATILGKWNGSTGYALRMSSANVFRLEIDGTGLETTATLADATWGHVVGVWNGATREIYINSVLVSSGALTTFPSDTAHDFNISGYNSASERFDGLVDEPFIPKRWLRAEEIKTIYCKGLAGKELTYSEIQLGGNQVIWIL